MVPTTARHVQFYSLEKEGGNRRREQSAPVLSGSSSSTSLLDFSSCLLRSTTHHRRVQVAGARSLLVKVRVLTTDDGDDTSIVHNVPLPLKQQWEQQWEEEEEQQQLQQHVPLITRDFQRLLPTAECSIEIA